MPESHPKPTHLLDEEKELPPIVSENGDGLPRYAELHCISNFSFQRGASHPQELVRRAYDLGYEAIAITDECSVAGVVRAWTGWKEYRAYIERLEQAQPGVKRLRPFQLIFGSEFAFPEGRLIALATDLPSWGGLCQFITQARMGKATKGQYQVSWEMSDLALLQGCEVLFAPHRQIGLETDLPALRTRLRQLRQLHGEHAWLAVELPYLIDDDLWLAAMQSVGHACGLPLVASRCRT
jgi:error-prone DNA polymerase